jgi:inhibitor of cysteine peptidase
MYYRYINFLTQPTATYMKREIATAVAASLALLLLLNISPQPPQNATPAPQSPALPVVKLSELERLSPTYLYSVPAVLATLTAAVPLSASADTARATAVAANLQVAGVDEEDYVKFDGENLYVAAAGRVYVVGPDLAVKASASCPAYDCVVFVWGGRLLTYGMGEFGFVKAYLYRLPDMAKIAEFNFSGVPIAARMAGGYVYIVAAAAPPDVVINGARVDEAPLLSLDSPPAVLIVAAVDMERGRLNASAFVSGHAFRIYMKDGRLYIAAAQGIPQLLYKAAVKAWDRLPPDVKAKLDLANPLALYKSLQDLLKVRGYADDVIEALNSAKVTTTTGIYIFDLDGLNIRLRAAAEVPGRLLDQFAIEELDGHLVVATTVAPVKFQTTRYAIQPLPRGEAVVISQDGRPVATIPPPPPPAPPPAIYATEGEPSNSVYVLTPHGRIAGALEGLAPGERIYAARLLGKTLYLVTFRQVDPLFAIDLSNPAAPRVLGLLKIPGFSEYLHPVDADRLLGVGAYERGLKIALFDISNPTQLREVSNITATGLHSPVFYDHHAFAYSPELRLAMVPAASWYGAGYVLAVEVRDKLALRAVINATADRAFFGRDAIYLVGRSGGVQIWKYTTDLRLVAEARLR